MFEFGMALCSQSFHLPHLFLQVVAAKMASSFLILPSISRQQDLIGNSIRALGLHYFLFLVILVDFGSTECTVDRILFPGIISL